MKIIAKFLFVFVYFLSIAAWWPSGPLDPNIDYLNLDIGQGLGDYYLWSVAYDKYNDEAMILFSGYGNPIPWQRIPTAFDQDYIFTDIYVDYGAPDLSAIVVGYKKEGSDKYKGIILRGNGSGFDDITGNIPSSFPCQQSPTPFLSVSRPPDWPFGKIIVTGGFGTILLSTDNGETWNYTTGHPNSDPEERMSDWYYSSNWSTEDYPYPILICGDNSGLLSWSYNDGVDWQTKDFPMQYEITDYGSYSGKLTPLCIKDDACGMAFGYVAMGIPGWTCVQISYDNQNPPVAQNWWWWYGTDCSYHGWMFPLYSTWFVGSNGGILRCDTAMLDPDNCHWERQPASETDSCYQLNEVGIGIYDDLNWVEYYGHALGTDGYELTSVWHNGPPGSVPNPPAPNPTLIPEPGVPQNLAMVYDPIYEGYNLYWDPPSNYKDSHVAAYWVCPTNDESEWFIFNQAPIVRTTYFLYRPTGQWQDGRVCAMRRDGLSGPWTPWVWLNTIDKMVDCEATGRNNARTLISAGNTFWAFWEKGNNIYAASSADSGKNWTYQRGAVPSLGNGEYPAADSDNSNNPIVCWVENVIEGSLVTAYLHYRFFDGCEWSTTYTIKQESFSGSGYLYPSVSVDESNCVHIVYGKSYNNDNDWQLWYGKFSVTNPLMVSWHLLDSQSGISEITTVSSQTIGTDRYCTPMVIWNRPNANTLHFGYQESGNPWQTRILDFCGTLPCIEIEGTTARLTFVNSGDIFYATGGIGGFGKESNVSNTLTASSSPVIADDVIIWQEYVNSDWEIYYSYLQKDLTWTSSQKLSGYEYLPDQSPKVLWSSPYAYFYWIQGDTKRVLAFSRTLISSEQEQAKSAHHEVAVTSESRSFNILSIHPNPARGTIHISFVSPDRRAVTVKLYDISGRMVKKLFDGRAKVGVNKISYSRGDLASGVYFLRLETRSKRLTEKILFQR